MCGVVAVASWRRAVGAELGRGVAALAHRGPDGSGTWCDPLQRAALGHTRLALVDRGGGAQPIASEDGQVVAVVSGEIYEHARLRAELEARGHRFRSASDSEIVVHAYEQDGDAFVERLRGEFAIVIWDARAGRLLAARDRFGVRSLVFAEHDGALWIASETKALFAMGVPAAWAEDALHQACLLQYPPVGRTLFRGVRELAPGQLLMADAEGQRVRTWWDCDFPREGAHEAVTREELAAALEDAVRVRLHGEGRICVQLSGGVDSSAVAALARPEARACFTVGFAGVHDESAAAESVARRLGLDWHGVRLDADTLAAAFPRAVAHADALVINAHAAAKYSLSRAMRDAGYRVVLTGEGADEVFAGYAHLRRDRLLERGADAAELARLAASNSASAGLMLPAGDGIPLDAVRAQLGFVPSWLQSKATLGWRVAQLLAPAFRSAYAERFLEGIDVAQLAGRTRIDVAAYSWCKTALAGYILATLGDGMEMAHSIEGRTPFLDHHLFELARRIPPDDKLGPHGKGALRAALEGTLPRDVCARPKHPFLAPPIAGHPALMDVLRSPSRFFDRAAVARVCDAYPGWSEHERVAWEPALLLIASATILERSRRL
jgi:asparagine synthase (glutamine-hydrolysing)